MGKHLRRSAVWTIALVALLVSAGVTRQIVVSSVADSGTGTLRWALGAAQSGDTITFDGQVFPAKAAATIHLRSELPPIRRGGITLDGSDAGVIIDGSRIAGDWHDGLQVRSDRNVVRGLQIVHFTGSGIAVCSASYNTIGGDRSVGKGPLGQGNLVCGNGIGIDLCDSETGNIITGNLVGVQADGRTPSGNNCQGIWVENGVTNTRIGPGNVIAYNGCAGIEISGKQAINNTVTQNAIYENAGVSLQVWQGANSGLLAPALTASDMTGGLVQGTAYGRCRVEVFSSAADGCDYYEGTVEADSAGEFALRLQVPLRGPNITLVATDASGNSSPGASYVALGRVVLQSGNTLPQAYLVPKPSWELEDSGIGVDLLTFSSDLWDNYRNPGLVYELGFKWMRISAVYDPLNWQRVVQIPGRFVVDPAVDELITEYSNNGISIVLNLGVGSGPDGGAGNLANERPDRTRFKREDDIRRYCDFARFMVEHFEGRVHYYEIWNEPNSDAPWGGIDIEDYVNLVRHVAPVIREANPDARIVVGALSGVWSYPFPGYGPYSRCAYELEQFLPLVASDVIAMVDVISWHPFYGTRPDDPYYQHYAELVSRIKDSAVTHGFDGEFLAEEVMWKRQAETDEASMPVSPHVAAVYYARSVLVHRSLNVVVTSNLWNIEARTEPIHTTFTSLCTVMAGCEATKMPAEITIDCEPVAYCAFRYPNGDRIFAVWSDGVAQDDDLGVMATITFPGIAVGTVSGIDVLNGFEQEVVFETDGGSIVIRDLLVKEYPILIRLGNVATEPDYGETVGDGFHRLGEPEIGGGPDRDGDGGPDDKDYCPDWPGKLEANGC